MTTVEAANLVFDGDGGVVNTRTWDNMCVFSNAFHNNFITFSHIDLSEVKLAECVIADSRHFGLAIAEKGNENENNSQVESIEVRDHEVTNRVAEFGCTI